MKRIPFVLGIAIAVILSGTISPVLAGDKEDLEARIVKYHEVWNAKNADAFVTYFSSNGLTLANAGGGLFGDPIAFLNNTLDVTTLKQAWEDPDVQVNQTPRYIQVSIYGNVGVANYYRMGNQTNAEGVTNPVRLRVTEVWVKERGQWRAVNRHLSPFRIGAQNI